jgi:hypothetical protein
MKNICKILAFLGGFEFMSHISFLKFKTYPVFKNNIIYPIFSLIDPSIHFLYFFYNKNDIFKYLFLMMGVWHFIKIFNKKLKNNVIINLFDSFLHFKIAYSNIKYGFLGMIFYLPIRYLKLTW